MNDKVSIGLDVGNRHINMVKLSNTTKRWQLTKFASVKINSNQGQQEKMRQLERLVQEQDISGSAVNIGVSGESIIVRYIELPKMNKGEITQALKFEAQQYIPFKIEEVIFDYHILEPPNSNRNRMKILLVAAKKQVITEFIELMNQIGLKPNLIDINSFSLINCFQNSGPPVKKEDIFALINLEFDLVNIDILQGETPFFTRDISLLEDVLSMRQEEGKGKQIFEMARPLLENLIREIRVSIDYYESEFEKQVAVIYLSGEAAKVSELVVFFSEQLGREVKVWNPVQNLLVDSAQVDQNALKEVSPMLALACGLALRGGN